MDDFARVEGNVRHHPVPVGQDIHQQPEGVEDPAFLEEDDVEDAVVYAHLLVDRVRSGVVAGVGHDGQVSPVGDLLPLH